MIKEKRRKEWSHPQKQNKKDKENKTSAETDGTSHRGRFLRKRKKELTLEQEENKKEGIFKLISITRLLFNKHSKIKSSKVIAKGKDTEQLIYSRGSFQQMF